MAPKTAAASTSHRWRFFRAGGVDQVRIDSGSDIVNLGELDQKLWVALSCPVKGLEFDERTLTLLDTDKDGRVRAPEIIAAVGWVAKCLVNPDDLVEGREALPLAAINPKTSEGKRVLAAAKRVLIGLGRAKATEITVADTMETATVLAQSTLNGDGIVVPESIEDAATKKVAEELLACLGGDADRSGKPGFGQARIDAFFAELEAFTAWWNTSEADAKAIRPLGDGTAAAYGALSAVAAKVDDYFARCRLAAYDPRASQALNREESAYIDIAAKDLSITAQEIAHFPLAKIEAGKPLALGTAVNPAWEAAMASFKTLVVEALLDKNKTSITEAEWKSLRTRFDAFAAWSAKKAGAKVESLGIARVREILASGAKDALARAVAEDLAVAPEIDAITDVERLARYYRDLHQLLNNFVNFSDFYSRRRKAVFQAGTLYLDGRSCDLCVRVDDSGKHGALASLAKTYLAYVDCARPGSGGRMTVAAAFTAGDSDNLMVGRNGLFYDRKGNDWDATITKIVDNPISIGQAFWSPYKRLLRWIEEQVAKRAAAADEAASAKLTTAATAAGDAAKTGKAPEAKPKFDIGVVAALGVAVGGITAALGALLESFFGLGKWMPLGLVGLVFLISGPSMVIAWLKLRQRNLGPILDANGWAVNGRAKVNIPLGSALTETATLPAGSERSLFDPYAPKKRLWPRIVLALVILVLVLWGMHHVKIQPVTGWIDQGIQFGKDALGIKDEPPAPAPETPAAPK